MRQNNYVRFTNSHYLSVENISIKFRVLAGVRPTTEINWITHDMFGIFDPVYFLASIATIIEECDVDFVV